jgi:hypothetical protein
MKGADPALRGYLSAALCRIGAPALARLRKLYTGPDEELRSCAELTLWGMGEDGILAMVDSMRDKEKGD